MVVIYWVIDIIFWVIEALLGLRFLLKFFGANSGVPFVRWIYSAAEAFLAPFIGIFPAPAINGRFVVEFSTLFAIIVYALVYYLILWILSLILPPLGPSGRDMTDDEIAAQETGRRRNYRDRYRWR